MATTEIYLVRHGETAANSRNIVQGQSDVPLNERGLAQAARLAERLKDMRFDAVYASDLDRAMRTARIVAPHVEVIPSKELREWDLGDWVGRPFEEVKRLYPDEVDAFLHDHSPCPITGGESKEAAYDRVNRFLDELDIVYIATERLAGVSGVDTYFVKEKNEQIFTDNTGSYYRLPAIVNGEKTEIKVDATKTYTDKSGNSIDFTKNSTVYGLFAITNVVKDKNDIITSFVDVTGDVFDASTSTTNKTSGTVGTVRVASGVLGIGAKGDKDLAKYYAYDSNTVAYYVDKDYKDINVINISSIANDTNDYVYGVRDDNVPANYKKLSEVVVVEQEDSTVETHTVSITGANGNAWVDEVNGTHYANQTSITVEDGEDFQFKLAPLAGKKVVSVKVGSTELTPDVNGVYTVSNVTGDITVDVTCGNVLKLTVTNSDDAAITVAVNGNAPEAVSNGASTAGDYEVTNGQMVTVTIVYNGTTPALAGTTNATVIPVSQVGNSITYQVYIGNATTAPVVTFTA